MIGERLQYILFFSLIVFGVFFISPAVSTAQSEENAATGLASKLKLETLQAYIEEKIDGTEVKTQNPLLSAAEVALGTNLKAYFSLKVPSMTILTKKQNLNYSRALFGLNLAF